MILVFLLIILLISFPGYKPNSRTQSSASTISPVDIVFFRQRRQTCYKHLAHHSYHTFPPTHHPPPPPPPGSQAHHSDDTLVPGVGGDSPANPAAMYQSHSNPDLSQLSYEDWKFDYPEHVLKVYKADQSCKYLLVHKVREIAV